MEDDEILTAVHFPASAKGRRWGFAEVARRHGDFALVGAAVTVDAADDGTCREARVALLGVAEAAVRARGSEAVLQGAALADTDAIEEAARIAADGLSPRSDVHASSVYRAEVASTVVRRALEQAMSRGEG